VTRSLRLSCAVLAFLASCVASPQPSPPNLAPQAVSATASNADIVDGVRMAGAPGAVDPAEGVIVGTNLDDASRAPVAEPVRADGSFDIVVPGSLTGELRLQARNGSARSEAFDFVLDATLTRLDPAPRPLSCMSVHYELDLGDVRVGDSAEDRVLVENGCTEDIELLAPRLRESDGPFEVTGEATVVPAGASIEITVRAAPLEPGALEGTLFVEAALPMRDRRAVTLFVRGLE
jgi:hypothetical protein